MRPVKLLQLVTKADAKVHGQLINHKGNRLEGLPSCRHWWKGQPVCRLFPVFTCMAIATNRTPNKKSEWNRAPITELNLFHPLDGMIRGNMRFSIQSYRNRVSLESLEDPNARQHHRTCNRNSSYPSVHGHIHMADFQTRQTATEIASKFLFASDAWFPTKDVEAERSTSCTSAGICDGSRF